MSPTLISARDVAIVTSLSRASIYRMVAQGKFPKPVPISEGRKGWVASEVHAFVAERIAQRDNPTPV